MLVHSALQLNLSHLIAVEGVDVENNDAALSITIRYVLLLDRTAGSATFTFGGAV